jgi:glycosyltransferase involved in cell wall biosynthesis
MNNFLYVLIRTHKRPQALRRCINSLCEQTKKNFSAVIISDYEKDSVENLSYEYPDLYFKFIRVRPLGYPACNLHLNDVKNHIDSNYVIFVDDDNIVIDNTYFETIENISNMQAFPAMISKAQFPGRLIPSDNGWCSYPRIGNIDSLNFCVRTDIYKKCNWSGSRVGDFHFIKNVFDSIDWKNEVLWYNNITTKVGDKPRYGKSEY